MSIAYSLNQELVDAVLLSDPENVCQVIERGADPDARDEDGRPVLMIAVAEGDRESARLLLEAGADPNLCDADGWTSLDLAVCRQGLDFLWLLVQFGAAANPRPDTGAKVLLHALGPGLEAAALPSLVMGRDVPSWLTARAAAVALAARWGVRLDCAPARGAN